MARVDAAKYSDLGINKSTAEVGVSIQTPVTDGKRVYVSYVAALLACYDMEGKRQWVRARPLELHGERVMYPPSPILAAGRFIAHNPWGTVALDAETGDEKWRIARGDYKVDDIADPALKRYFKQGLDCITGSLLCLTLDAEPLVITTSYVVRARDGKFLACTGEQYGNGYRNYQTPILNGATLYRFCKLRDEGGLVDLEAWSLPPSAAEPFTVKKEWSLRIDTTGFPIHLFGASNSSPLYHEGLIYCVSQDGVLSVIDVEERAVVYQQLLDADSFTHVNYGAGNGFMSASPALAGKYIYLFGNQGTCLVIEPGRSFKLVAGNRVENWVGGHQEIMVSSPVFEGSRLYFRTDGHVYCIEEKP